MKLPVVRFDGLGIVVVGGRNVEASNKGGQTNGKCDRGFALVRPGHVSLLVDLQAAHDAGRRIHGQQPEQRKPPLRPVLAQLFGGGRIAAQ